MNKLTIGPECETIYLEVERLILSFKKLLNYNIVVQKYQHRLLLEELDD